MDRIRTLALGALVALLALMGCAQGDGGAVPTVVLGGAPTPTPPNTQSQVRAPRLGGVTASAQAAPAQTAQLAWAGSGRVAAVAVAAGERVSAGQVLLTLDDQAVTAQLAQAQAALDAAQAGQALLLAGPTEEVVRQAQAVVAGAQARVDALRAGPRPEPVTQAAANLASAQAALARLSSGPTALELEAARLGIAQARDALWAAQSERDVICGGPLAEAQCDRAEAGVLVAEGAVRQAENQLAQLQQGADAASVTQAEQAVRAAAAQVALAQQPTTEFDLAAAQAQLAGAQAALDALQAGPRAAELTAAEAQVAAAQAQLAVAEAQRSGLALTAPFDGTVTALKVHAGQAVTPGQVAVALATLDQLVIETTDLSELDVPKIKLGQTAVVNVAALGRSVDGQVSAIAPLAETLGGDVIYRVTITLEGQPTGLRAGMSAEVTF